MAGWFDDLAKRSARRHSGVPEVAIEQAPAAGLSRRQVLVRGAAVAGAAWTAPMLMATQAAALGISACPSGLICGNADGEQICCPNSTDTCQIDRNGTPSCIPEGELGGSCGNMGVGNCDDPNRCNGNLLQSNNALEPNICGGEGAVCGDPEGASCFEEGEGITCFEGFCRRDCTVDTDCNTGQVCDPDGFCAKPCLRDNNCIGDADCVDNFCTYVDRPN